MFDFTLIIPTYGRDEQLKNLLISLLQQNYDMRRVEIIVVDQNDKIDLSEILRSFSEYLNIVHIQSNVKSISRSKNLGIKAARANIIAFPDDDCLYYPDTLDTAFNFMADHPEIEVVYGRLYDREAKKNIMRKWSTKILRLNKLNFHLNYSPIACFTRDKYLFFDENLGVGSRFGMGEELDYIMRLVMRGSLIYFLPQLEIWHPQTGLHAMSNAKTRYYAEGYGATFRKNPEPIFILIFLTSCLYQFCFAGIEILRGDPEMSKKRWLAFTGRLHGFIAFGRFL